MIKPKKTFRRIAILSLPLFVAFSSCEGQPLQTTTGNIVAQPASRPVENIRSMLQDKNGNYWFGSDGGGVYRYDGKVLLLFTDKDGLGNNQIRSIQEDNTGNVWLETGNGICRYDALQYGLGKPFKNFKEVAAMNGPSAAWQKEPGDLWFAGAKGSVYRYDGDSFFNYQFPGAEAELRTSTLPYNPYDVYCTFEDKAGDIWFGTQSKGVCRFDGKTFTWFADKGLAGAAVRVIFQDRAGNLWFGNNGYGLFRYDGKSLINFTEEKGLSNPDFIKSFKEREGTLARIWAVNEDANGDLWIGTIDAGAWRYDGKKLINYTTKDGLTERGITAIYKDKKGELWFGTAGEMCKFNGKSFNKVGVK